MFLFYFIFFPASYASLTLRDTGCFFCFFFCMPKATAHPDPFSILEKRPTFGAGRPIQPPHETQSIRVLVGIHEGRREGKERKTDERDMIASDARELRLSASPLAPVFSPRETHFVEGGRKRIERKTLAHTCANNHTRRSLLVILCLLLKSTTVHLSPLITTVTSLLWSSRWC